MRGRLRRGLRKAYGVELLFFGDIDEAMFFERDAVDAGNEFLVDFVGDVEGEVHVTGSLELSRSDEAIFAVLSSCHPQTRTKRSLELTEESKD